jgi:nucleoside-diphosphate-sugar epimerase
MRLAVTGASGFCGGAVARLAAERGHDVVCLGRRPGPVGTSRRWDAAREDPDLSAVDAVVHCAAAVGDPAATAAAESWFRAVNVDGAARLLAAAGDLPVVWVGSSSAYDPGAGQPVREDAPMRGQLSAYGRTKAEGDRLAVAAGARVLRPRAVYGPGDRHLLPRLQRLVRGGRLLLPGPDVQVSLTAVDNLAAACLAALTWQSGPYNVADAAPYSRDEALRSALGARQVVHLPVAPLRALAAAGHVLGRRTGRPPVLSPYALDLLVRGVVLDLSRALAQGYRPEASLTSYALGRGASL